jgi:glycosyltransferase involved in cell wall biosynthesis
MQNLPKTSLPVVLVEHNVEYDVYKKFAEKALIFFKAFLYLDVLKIKIKEEMYWKKAKKLVSVSSSDAKWMSADAIVPNGVDIEKYRPARKRKDNKKVLFIGDFKWIQNRDAVEWILKKVWPAFTKSFRGKPLLWIVGKNIPKYLKNKKTDSVFFDENAPSETEIIYQEASVMLAPIRIGGGTSFKILEAMSTGLPVITTPLGNAIMAKPGKDIITCETPEDFAKNLIRILSDKKEYEKISKNASEFIKNNYDWRNIVIKLEKVYKQAL